MLFRSANGQVALVDSYAAWTEPKTKSAVSTLSALGLSGKVLVVLSRDDVVAARSFRNLDNVKTIDALEINTYDVLNADWVLFSESSLPVAKENN